MLFVNVNNLVMHETCHYNYYGNPIHLFYFATQPVFPVPDSLTYREDPAPPSVLEYNEPIGAAC